MRDKPPGALQGYCLCALHNISARPPGADGVLIRCGSSGRHLTPEPRAIHLRSPCRVHRQGLVGSTEAALPAAPYNAKLRRCQFVRAHANRVELRIRPLSAVAVRADKKVGHDRFPGISQLLRAEPSHSDAAIRTVRGVELPQCFL